MVVSFALFPFALKGSAVYRNLTLTIVGKSVSPLPFEREVSLVTAECYDLAFPTRRLRELAFEQEARAAAALKP